MSYSFHRLLYLGCVCLASAVAQEKGSGDRRIELTVAVTEKSGSLVPGLAQQDFTLLDNKQPQTILSFQAVGNAAASANPPLEAVLVMDQVNTSFTSVSFARDQVVKFLRQSGSELPYPVSLVFFSDTNAPTGAPTRDTGALLAELNEAKHLLRVIGRSQGFYGAGDRLDLSLRLLGRLIDEEAPKPGRKLVIWVGPGWPLLSGPNVQLTGRDQQDFFHRIVELSAGMRRAGVTLYAVDPTGATNDVGLRTTYYEQFVKGVKSPKQVYIGDLGLQVLATQSGGLVLNSNNEIAAEISRCINDASAYYVISFNAPPGDGPNEYHALELKVDKPGVTARTRTGYYAQPD